MTTQSIRRLISSLKHFSRIASATVMLAGSLALVGWILDIVILRSVFPGLPQMMGNTALGFVLAGVSLWLVGTHPAQSEMERRQRRIAHVCACGVVLLGLVTLAQYVFGWDVGIDQVLMKDMAGAVDTSIPGRPSPHSAGAFILVGLALLFLDLEVSRRKVRPAQYLALLGVTGALLALFGYAYNVAFLYGISDYTGMALHTTVLFILLFVGILLPHPDQGLPAIDQRQTIFKRLTVHYIAALGTVALVSLFGEGLVQVALNQQSSDAHVINLAGRQRMLGQKLSKAALALEFASAPAVRKERIQELRGVVTLWERSQSGLQRGDVELGLPGQNSAWVTRLFVQIEPHYQSTLHAAKRLIAVAAQGEVDSSGGLDTSPLVEKILAEEARFLEGMNDIVFAYDREAGVRMRRLKRVEMILLSTTLIVLLLTGLFLFRPMVRRIRQCIYELEQGREVLQGAHDGLEREVDERTAELAAANEQLERELGERQRAEAALRRSEANYRSLIQGATYGIYRCSPEGRFLDVNPALVLMLGYESEADLLTADMATQVYCDPDEFTRLLAKHPQRWDRLEIEWKRKDGTPITVRLSGRVVLYSQGNQSSMEGIVENVTEQRLLEAQLRQAQKMEAVGQLAGGVAHDFNNLLMVIRGYTELLLNRLGSDDSLRHDAEEVQKAAERATSLTQQLLAFSRKQVMQPKVFDLNTVVADTEKMLRRLIGEDIELVTTFGPKLGRVKADPSQIGQVILNLAVNARDAMPQGGKLLLETANVELTDAFARQHPGVALGPHVLLAVSDTGVGMDEKTRAQIFDPFFTTKEQGKGTGLGLATVYGIIKQSGGYIWAYSEPGQGATFEIYLPQVVEAVAAADPDQPLASCAPGWETILLVEDEEGVRKLMREFLENKGYTVLEARNGAEAIQLARHHHSPIHLMVTDIVMPQMGGRRLAERLAPIRPETKVLYMSGYTDDAIIRHGFPGQSTPLVLKPFSLDVLARTVRNVLDVRESSAGASAG